MDWMWSEGVEVEEDVVRIRYCSFPSHKEYNRSYYDAGLNKANVPILRIFISSLQPAASPRPCCRHGGGRVWWRRGGGVTASARNNRYPATSGRTSSAELQLRTHSWHIVTHRDTSWPGSSHSSSHVGLVQWWSEKLCYSTLQQHLAIVHIVDIYV